MKRFVGDYDELPMMMGEVVIDSEEDEIPFFVKKLDFDDPDEDDPSYDDVIASLEEAIFALSKRTAKNKPVGYIDADIENVIFNDPATIILWKDGTKTVVKCNEDSTYSKELGFALCVIKKFEDNKGRFNELFKKWVWKD